ncbi:MAG: GST-like protein [Limisphaerales bacterium]|jgi:GST-like protein
MWFNTQKWLASKMIDLYTFPTPNGRKISIALEEFGLAYEVHPVHIGKDEQFDPEFLKISPNNKIPAIVDRDTGRAMMESGAILIYLADKCDQFWGDDKYITLEWLMLQMGGVGPMLGQAHHFLRYNQGKAPYAEARYAAEAKRLYQVLDNRLAGNSYLAGSYSIADMATWPWISRYEWQAIDWASYPNLKRWYLDIAGREAVQKGYDVPVFVNEIPLPG